MRLINTNQMSAFPHGSQHPTFGVYIEVLFLRISVVQALLLNSTGIYDLFDLYWNSDLTSIETNVGEFLKNAFR